MSDSTSSLTAFNTCTEQTRCSLQDRKTTIVFLTKITHQTSKHLLIGYLDSLGPSPRPGPKTSDTVPAEPRFGGVAGRHAFASSDEHSVKADRGELQQRCLCGRNSVAQAQGRVQSVLAPFRVTGMHI